MKKKLLIALAAVILISTIGIAQAKTYVSPDLATAIKLYKAGNYTECYEKLETVMKNDPSNALGYYYKGMASAQLGRKAEAIENYSKALELAPAKSNLANYAEKGKSCMENPKECNNPKFDSDIDAFIRGSHSTFSEKVRSDYEKLKIEHLMRDINRDEEVAPQRFKEYKDFSSMNNTPETSPSNDEIVAAIRTLQKAGLYNNFNNNYSDLSLLTGDNRNNSMLEMMGTSSLSPQVIQAMLTNNMSLGF